ncbi:MAG TPA: hypothetical protein VK844_08160 [Hyphomicrobiales bacterium]|nr:hypothetical protein [Hyphomicrobiales bacterium]
MTPARRRRRQRPAVRGFDPATHPLAPLDYVIRAILDGLDQVALAMERKWGVGRLRLIVSDGLRARFDAQKDRLDAAIEAKEEAYVRAQAEGLRRAWAALDREASEAGCAPLSPEVWECVLPSSGEVVSLVRSEAEAHHVCRACRVFTLAEIGLLIEALGDKPLEVKDRFPGASLIGIHAKPPVDWEKGDTLPF